MSERTSLRLPAANPSETNLKPRLHSNLLLYLLLLVGGATWWWLARDPTAPIAASPAPSPDNLAGAPRFPDAQAAAPLLSAPSPSAAVTESTALANLISRYLSDGSADERDHALHILLPRLIAHDPAAAVRLALGWTPGLMRTELLGAVTRHWAEADLAAALAWLISLPDADDRRVTAAATTAWLAQSDPASALELGQWLGVGSNDGRLEHIVQLWTEEYPAEAIGWVTRQPAHRTRDLLLARVAHVRAQQAPLEAARVVLDHLPAGPGQDEALLTVVRHWAARDIGSAAAWVAGFPAGPLQMHAAAEIARARRLR